MTREDAIEEIKRWTPILLVSGQCTEKTSKAQDMAISALSENKGDLISRQAVINAVANTIVNGESLGYALAEEIIRDCDYADYGSV